MKIALPFTVLAVVLAGVSGCDGDSGGGGSASVTDIIVESGTIAPGAGSVVRVEFSFSSDDVFDDDDNVALAVQLPATVRFLVGSAEIQRAIEDNDVAPQVQSCADGSTVLVFDLDEDDLADASNPGGNADAILTLTVTGAVSGGPNSIFAGADENTITADCTGIDAEASDLIIVS